LKREGKKGVWIKKMGKNDSNGMEFGEEKG